jgi:hypothetical protein
MCVLGSTICSEDYKINSHYVNPLIFWQIAYNAAASLAEAERPWESSSMPRYETMVAG